MSDQLTSHMDHMLAQYAIQSTLKRNLDDCDNTEHTQKKRKINIEDSVKKEEVNHAEKDIVIQEHDEKTTSTDSDSDYHIIGRCSLCEAQDVEIFNDCIECLDKKAFCSECISECANCEETKCHDCFSTDKDEDLLFWSLCSHCHLNFCDNCRKKCKICDRYHCDDCVEEKMEPEDHC